MFSKLIIVSSFVAFVCGGKYISHLAVITQICINIFTLSFNHRCGTAQLSRSSGGCFGHWRYKCRQRRVSASGILAVGRATPETLLPHVRRFNYKQRLDFNSRSLCVRFTKIRTVCDTSWKKSRQSTRNNRTIRLCS